VTYRPPPVRPSRLLLRLTPRSRKRQAQAFVVAIATTLLSVVASASADPGAIAAKQAQAQQVLAQISQIDRNLEGAIEAYNLANVKLRKIEGDLRENRKQLDVARSNLTVAQKSLANRLVAAYTSTQDNSTLSVLLGSTSLEDLLNRVEAVNSTSRQDASILHQVADFKAAVKRHRTELRDAHAAQKQVVAEKAAQRQHIESQLAERRQLLSSIKGEIERMKAAEAAQQRRLAAAARARAAAARSVAASSSSSGGSTSSSGGSSSSASAPEPTVGVAAATPEGTTVAPPSTHGGVVGIAMQYLGVPYRWGGSSPSGFDCSGFVMYVFAQIGVSLPHSTYAMYAMGTPVSMGQLQPGDLVFFNGLGHMGIYIGGGQFIHSPHTGDVVKISSMSGYYASAFVGARRV
jgi:peptidoglycan DL-endopeptidase CwlO